MSSSNSMKGISNTKERYFLLKWELERESKLAPGHVAERIVWRMYDRKSNSRGLDDFFFPNSRLFYYYTQHLFDSKQRMLDALLLKIRHATEKLTMPHLLSRKKYKNKMMVKKNISKVEDSPRFESWKKLNVGLYLFSE